MSAMASKLGTAPASAPIADRKSTRLNSSHTVISYAVSCLEKKSEAALRRKLSALEKKAPADFGGAGWQRKPWRERRVDVRDGGQGFELKKHWSADRLD